VAESGGIPGRRPVFPAFRRQFTKDGEEYFTLWDQPLGPDGVCETVKAAGRAVGLEDLATHDLRRTLAQIMLDQGYTLRDIADMLGHESVGTTEAYLRKNMARGVKVGKRLSLRTA
jgi:site-specific recombinase XerD